MICMFWIAVTELGRRFEQRGDVPCGRWRHACCLLANDRYMLLSGGRTKDSVVLGDFFLLDLETWIWSKLAISDHENIAFRHSHRMVFDAPSNSIWIIGGLDANLVPSKASIDKNNCRC